MRRPRSVRDADVAGKHVLVRSDLNVPLEDGRVADDTRIEASVPTLHLLLGNGAEEVRVCSHLGRPKTEEDRETYSMEPVRARLHELLPDDRIVVLENTRFNPGETKNDPAFARELAEGSDLFVNDAFGSAHRAHASTVGVAELLPAYAGLLLEQELEMLGRLLGEVERPFVLISGGAKVEDKLGVLRNLGGRADEVLVGGKMAEELREANPLGFDVVLPRDVVAASEFDADAESQVVGYDALPEGWLGWTSGRRHGASSASASAAQDRLLERADGRLRVAPVCGGHSRGRAGGRRRAGLHGRRWCRLRACAARARPRGVRRLGVDRRRRVARAARGERLARRRRHPGGLNADRGELEDVQGAGRGA
jgi:3-phosphoglycerate kinase